MSDSKDIIKEFEKLLKSLDPFSAQLKVDIIAKVRQRLNEYENTINFDENIHNSNQLISNKSSLNQGFDETIADNNCVNDSNNDDNCLNSGTDQMIIDFENQLQQNIRKSKRISNRKKEIELNFNNKYNEQKVDSNYKKRFNSKLDIKADNKCFVNNNKSEQKLDSTVNTLNAEQESVENKTIDSNTNAINESLSQTDHKSVEKSEELVSKTRLKRKWRRAKDVNDLKCKHCGKMWRSLSHLEIHLRSHTGEKKYCCDECGQRFVQLAGLQVHLRRHKNDRPFKCDICEKAFYTKIDLTRHKSSHQELKKITHFCEICGKGFIDNRKLKNHIRFVHEKKDSVVCEICGHKTHGQHLLYAHKRVKHGEVTKHACPVCNAVIGSRNAFVIHLRAHADVRPCVCDFPNCGKQFRSTSQVARHKLAHKEGRHECDVCLKKFKTPHHLRRHKVIHSGEKPFECHLCDYRCNVNSNVVKHVKAVHGVINFSLANEHKTLLDPGEDALEKGSVVAEEVLKDITITKGEKMTLEKLKQLDEMKKREKQLIIKELTENLNHRKKLIKRRVNKTKKDILDDAIASTLNNNNSNSCNDSQTVGFHISETPINVAVSVSSMPEYSAQLPEIIQSQLIISGTLPSAQIYEIPSHSTHSLKSNIHVGDEHFKDVITLHFAN